MSFIDKELVKKHLRIVDSEEDTLLDLYIASAEKVICSINEEDYLSASEVSENIKLAGIFLAAHYYEHREIVSSGVLSEIPFGIKLLLNSARKNISFGIT